MFVCSIFLLPFLLSFLPLCSCRCACVAVIHSVCLPVLSVRLPGCLSACLSACMSTCPCRSVPPSVPPSDRPSIRPSVRPSMCGLLLDSCFALLLACVLDSGCCRGRRGVQSGSIPERSAASARVVCRQDFPAFAAKMKPLLMLRSSDSDETVGAPHANNVVLLSELCGVRVRAPVYRVPVVPYLQQQAPPRRAGSHKFPLLRGMV